MELKVAKIESDIKNLGSRFKDHLDDVRTLRGSWTMVTITLVGLIFGVVGVMVNGFSGVADKQSEVMKEQSALMKEQIEIKSDMKQITAELRKINHSIEAISKDHENIKR